MLPGTQKWRRHRLNTGQVHRVRRFWCTEFLANLQQEKRDRIATAPPRARKRPCVATHYITRSDREFDEQKTPSAAQLRTTDEERSRPYARPCLRRPTGHTPRLRCLQVRKEHVDERRNQPSSPLPAKLRSEQASRPRVSPAKSRDCLPFLTQRSASGS